MSVVLRVSSNTAAGKKTARKRAMTISKSFCASPVSFSIFPVGMMAKWSLTFFVSNTRRLGLMRLLSKMSLAKGANSGFCSATVPTMP